MGDIREETVLGFIQLALLHLLERLELPCTLGPAQALGAIHNQPPDSHEQQAPEHLGRDAFRERRRHVDFQALVGSGLVTAVDTDGEDVFPVTDIRILDDVLGGYLVDIQLVRSHGGLIAGRQHVGEVRGGESDAQERDVLVADAELLGIMDRGAGARQARHPVAHEGGNIHDEDLRVPTQPHQDLRIEDENAVRHAQINGSVRREVGGIVGILVADHLRIVEERRHLEIVRVHHEQALVGGHPEHPGIVFRHRTGIVRGQAVLAGKALETDLLISQVSHQDTGAAGRHPHSLPSILEERGNAPDPRDIQFRLQMPEQIQVAVQDEDAGSFRSDPDPSAVVLEHALHQVVPGGRNEDEAALRGVVTVQTVPRPGQDRAA